MQRPQLSRQHISSPLTVVDSDDEEGPVVEGWSIFENSTDSSSSETTLGLDAPQSPIWEDRLESFLRRRRAFSVDHEAAATPTKKRTKRRPSPQDVRAARGGREGGAQAGGAAAAAPRARPVLGRRVAARLPLFRT